MNVAMIHFIASDDKANTLTGKRLLESSADAVRDGEEMLRQRRGEVDPMVNFFYGNDKDMTVTKWVDGHECRTLIISIYKRAGDIAIEYAREQSGHYRYPPETANTSPVQ